MTTVTVTNQINNKSDSKDFPTQADAAAFILYLNTTFDSSTFTIEVTK